MKDKKLNNLIDMKDFSEKELVQKKKSTKRTDVAKDILQETAVTGKLPVEKAKTKDEVKKKELNNLISLDNFGEKEVMKDAKKTKRTDVAKDVIQEKKKPHFDPTGEEEKKMKKDDKSSKNEKGLTPAQKKMPKFIQDNILKKGKK